MRAAGASVGRRRAGDRLADSLASFTTTPFNGTLPLLVMAKMYAMVSPASVMPLPLTSTGVPAVLTRVSDAAGAVTGVLVVDGALVTSVPPGGVPVAVALLSTLPALHRPGVIVYVTGPQFAVPPLAASVAGVQAIGVADSFASLTTTPFSGTLPLLVTTKRVGDRVAGVGDAVAVDVDRRAGGLDQGQRRRGRSRPACWWSTAHW